MSNCSTTTTTTCYSCNSGVDCDCPNGVVDAGCVQYTGDDLENIDVTSGMYLDDILALLDEFVFAETDFEANSSDSIVGTTGGTNGHSPSYSVRIDPDDDNIITVSGLGIMANSDLVGDGKVKVNAADDKDYLEEQVEGGTDANNIITLTATSIGGVIYMVPSINIINLLNYINITNHELLCTIVSTCVVDPGECIAYMVENDTEDPALYSYIDCDGETVGPLSLDPTEQSNIFCAQEGSVTTDPEGLVIFTVNDYDCTSTMTTSTTTTSSSTTTTTTAAESNDFTYLNSSGFPVPFSVVLTDEGSLIDYFFDSTTYNSQQVTYNYFSLSATGELNIIRNSVALDSLIGIELFVGGSLEYNAYVDIDALGGIFTLSGLDTTPGTDMELTIYGPTGLTSTTTTTTTP